MREIKVRAWHVTQKRMFSAEELGRDQLTLSADGRGFVNVSGDSLEKSVFFGEEMIPLEYTGLHDKDGTEIYEGAIVREGGKVQPIEWLSEYAAFGYRTPTGTARLYGFAGEVIGEIHQNPELIP